MTKEELKDVMSVVLDEKMLSLEEKQGLVAQRNHRELEFLIKKSGVELEKKLSKNLLELETSLSKRLSSLEEKQEMESFRMRTDIDHLTMRANSSGLSTERIQRSPSGNGLLEPKGSWGRRPLYNR